MRFLKNLENILTRIEGWFVITFLWMMVIFTFLQVCLRAFYTHGHMQWANTLMGHMDWFEPLVRLLVLWLTFLGASLVTRENRHIRIDILGNILPRRFLAFRELILYIVCAAVSGFMIRVSVQYIKLEREFGGDLFAGIPSWICELIIPAGFFLIFLRFGIRAVKQAAMIPGGPEK